MYVLGSISYILSLINIKLHIYTKAKIIWSNKMVTFILVNNHITAIGLLNHIIQTRNLSAVMYDDFIIWFRQTK